MLLIESLPVNIFDDYMILTIGGPHTAPKPRSLVTALIERGLQTVEEFDALEKPGVRCRNGAQCNLVAVVGKAFADGAGNTN